MKKINLNETSPRRKFLQTLTAGSVAIGVASVLAPFQQLQAEPVTMQNGNGDPDEWFNQIKGKHRMVFDATGPHEIFPFAWPKVFMLTNAATGTPEKETNVVVVLRHNAIAYALPDSLWAKYNLGEMFKINDPKTKMVSVRNPFWKPAAGDFKVPGIGPVAIGINELQETGVMFCVCDMALRVNAAVIADMTKQKPEDVLKEMETAVLAGIQLVPSGVWAVGRAQEHGCGYCFVG
ncbi:MAG: twin-arginine translocation signal domain-containing protein [Ferruginibacter sp.]